MLFHALKKTSTNIVLLFAIMVMKKKFHIMKHNCLNVSF